MLQRRAGEKHRASRLPLLFRLLDRRCSAPPSQRLSPTLGPFISFRPDLSMAPAALLASMALCAAGSLYPAWRAASMNPADALRRL
jgi:ABC-type antimicrobial peptide transport system permease subunit